MTTKKCRKAKAYQTPIAIVPAKVAVYGKTLPSGGKNERPPPDRHRKAAAQRAAREADRIGQREREAAQRALGTDGAVFEAIDRLGKIGVDYSRLLSLVEAAGSRAWLARMHLDQIHAIARDASVDPWDFWQRVRLIIATMEHAVEQERRQLEELAMENPLHKRIKAKDRESGGPAGW